MTKEMNALDALWKVAVEPCLWMLPGPKLKKNLMYCFENLGMKARNGATVKIVRMNKAPYGWHLILSLYPGLHVGNLIEHSRAFDQAVGGEVEIYRDKSGWVHMKIYMLGLPDIINYSKEMVEYIQKYPCAIPIGVSGRGVEILNLANDITYHALIAGMPGTGKSILLRTIIVSLLQHYSPEDVQFYLLDLKQNVGMTFFENFPHVVVSEGEPEKAGKVLSKLQAEMKRRGELMKKHRVTSIANLEGIKLPHILFVVDEFAQLDEMKAIEGIASLGRYVGVHCILCTQRPEVKIVSGNIKANIPVRIAFRMQTDIDSRTILGVGGAQYIENIAGRAVLQIGGRMRMIQGLYMSDKELQTFVEPYQTKVVKLRERRWVP